ncbi:MAG: hypothetical protein FD143_3555 [Ignavibacteria bacterium]|nr:MAG: hypothetical protein FD143_3555 [Ignavibacteria bacterium]
MPWEQTKNFLIPCEMESFQQKQLFATLQNQNYHIEVNIEAHNEVHTRYASAIGQKISSLSHLPKFMIIAGHRKHSTR